MKKRYLKLTGIISSSILSCGLIISPISSKATVRPRTFSAGSGGSNRVFRPLQAAPTSALPDRIERPTPLKGIVPNTDPGSNPVRPYVTIFNPLFDETNSTNSNGSLGSAQSSIYRPFPNSSTGNNTPNNTNNNLPSTQNQNNHGRRHPKLTFTNVALGGISAMSIIGAGLMINEIVKAEQKNQHQNNKPNQGNNDQENLNQVQQQKP